MLQCVLIRCSDVVFLTRKTGVVWFCCSQKSGESVNLCTVLRVPENGFSWGSLLMLDSEVFDFKDLKTILRVWRVCVKVGKGSAYDCCHLDVPPRKCKWLGIGGF